MTSLTIPIISCDGEIDGLNRGGCFQKVLQVDQLLGHLSVLQFTWGRTSVCVRICELLRGWSGPCGLAVMWLAAPKVSEGTRTVCCTWDISGDSELISLSL